MTRRGTLMLLVGLGALTAVGVGVSARAFAAPEATVTYYFIPGCSTCARTSARLAAVLAPHCGRVALRLVENRSTEGRAAVRQYHFATHGLVLTDAVGHAALVESDHRVFPEHVGEALGRILPPSSAP